LGLDTHDIDLFDRNTVFEEGMVWTVEPGIYIEEENIGIRIEDDILVKSTGVEVLTKNMIKSIEDIENYMSKS
jgi:Xaa-Pro aminopeptidase